MTAVGLTDQPDDGGPPLDGDEFGGRDDADDEALKMACAIVAGPYCGLGGRTLKEVLLHADTAKEAGAAELLGKGLPSGLADVRAVLAAAALTFRACPARYDAFFVGPRAIAEVLALRPEGPRGEAIAEIQARAIRDVAAGRALLDLLGRGQ